MAEAKELSSAGHRLGQIIGDWWECHVVSPLLQRAANDLDLYLDSRFITRTCRGDKILWPDADGNMTDYDFVLELGGSSSERGIPVGFVETFWRRGSRHSKDKSSRAANRRFRAAETKASVSCVVAHDFRCRRT